MSFRARLRLFFVLIVIVPMLSVAIVLFRLISDNETGKADAGLNANVRAARSLFIEATRRAEGAVEGVGSDRVLADALLRGDLARARERARQLLASRGIERISLHRGTRVIFDVGHRDAVAPGRRDLSALSGRRLGLLEASVTRAAEYARLARRVTGVEIVVGSGGHVLADTLPDGRVAPALPEPGHAEHMEAVDGSYRGATFLAAGFLGKPVEVGVLAPDTERSSNITDARLLAGGILLGFLVLALTFALAVSRSLQAQIGAFLQAARRLGAGDFATNVPTPGRDEFAELGEEFNKMSRQLAEHIQSRDRQRERLEQSMRRIGESFASNLDRDALLEIVVRAAVDGVEAQGGRACVRPADTGPLEEHARAGELNGVGDAVREAESEVLVSGVGGEARVDDVHALAHPLHGADGTGI